MNAPLTTPARAQTEAHALSPSQVSTFLDCAARWYFGKVLKLPDPQNGALALGRAIHAAAAAVMREKAAAGGELPGYDLALETFSAAWAEELSRAELAPDEQRIELADTGRRMLQLWHTQVAPEISPAAVELPISGVIGGTHVNAIIDLVTTDGTVIDLKTAAKKPGAIRADHAFQLATYGMLGDYQTARLVTITKTTTPAIVQHTLDIGPQQRRHAEAIYPIVAAAMQSGIYPPRRSSLLCSRKHCPFWRECIAEFGGEVN
jgi:RecB family exonuclease